MNNQKYALTSFYLILGTRELLLVRLLLFNCNFHQFVHSHAHIKSHNKWNLKKRVYNWTIALSANQRWCLASSKLNLLVICMTIWVCENSPYVCKMGTEKVLGENEEQSTNNLTNFLHGSSKPKNQYCKISCQWLLPGHSSNFLWILACMRHSDSLFQSDRWLL